MRSFGKVRVVIADNERRARSFLSTALRKYEGGEVVSEAANGTEALSLIEAKRPGLAVLDLHMPKLLWRHEAGVAISNLRFRGYTTTESWDHTR